ncbi:MAG TPA: hypothetical protein VMH02_07245 [Verrucomicrobiae bacterium]|nr:hypothetical protein [Verrucomicrobiae bacterium]
MYSVLAAALLAVVISSPAPSPYEIFARAREYWQTQRYPGELEYDVVVRVVEGGKVRIEHYRSGYDGYTGDVRFDAVSEEEHEHPHVVKGANLSFFFWRIGRADAPVDYLGVADLAPNYGFGIGRTPLSPPPHSPTPAELVREIREQFHDPDPHATPTPAPAPTPALREIASVFSKDRAYDITLAGIDRLAEGPAYHLQLKPLRQPKKYRLRDLWVDTATFAPRKLTEALNFVDGPGTDVPWNVTFAQIGGALYIDKETALAAIDYDGEIYREASVSIENLREVAKLPRDLTDFTPATLILREP